METIISGSNWGATQMHLFGLGLRTTVDFGTRSLKSVQYHNQIVGFAAYPPI
jgi:hypothetical protein